MADYNIYIHDLSSGASQESQTTPWKVGAENNQTKAWATSAEGESGVGNGSGFSLSSLLAVFKGGSAASSVPAVAGVIAAYGIATRFIDTTLPFITRETGDYRFAIQYQNFKAAIHTIWNPVSATISYLTFMQESRLFNKKQEQGRLLVGESYNNFLNKRGR